MSRADNKRREREEQDLRFWALGLGVQGLGGCRGFRVLGVRVQGVRCRVPGSGFDFDF